MRRWAEKKLMILTWEVSLQGSRKEGRGQMMALVHASEHPEPTVTEGTLELMEKPPRT